MLFRSREIEQYRFGLESQEDHILDSLAMHTEIQVARRPYQTPVLSAEDHRRQKMSGYRKQWALVRKARGGGNHWDRYLPT